jgi:hypothetical protein
VNHRVASSFVVMPAILPTRGGLSSDDGGAIETSRSARDPESLQRVTIRSTHPAASEPRQFLRVREARVSGSRDEPDQTNPTPGVRLTQ